MTSTPEVQWAAPLQALALWRDPVGTIERWRRRHGDVFSIALPVPGPMTVVGEPYGAADVMRSDPARACAGSATGRVLPLLGAGCVLRMDGPAHLERRRLLNPLFRGGALAICRPAITEIVERELAQWPVGRPFRSLPRLQRLAFAVIAHVVLGMSDQLAVEELHRLVRRSTGPMALAGTWMWPVRPGPLRDAALAGVRRREQAVSQAIGSLVAAGLVGGDGQPRAVDRVADALCAAARDGQLLLSALDHELRALLVVGHETAAAALGWALERLARERSVQSRLVQSLQEGHTDLLRAFIFEVLRWRAPVVDTVRQLKEPLEVGPHRIDPGTLVVVSPHLVHHHPDLHPAPSEFASDRFVGRLTPDPKGWIPFGGGVRRCLGADLALLEMEVALSSLLDRLTIVHSCSPSEAARLAGTVVLPSRGAEITLTRTQRAGG